MQNEQIIFNSNINFNSDNLCINGTNNNKYDRSDSNFLSIYKKSDKKSNLSIESINLNKNIYRFKFTLEIMNKLNEFSKINQYNDRISFKENWNEWLNINNELIENECKRLFNLQYKGNIIDKMFKSARYYYRKKSNETKQPIERKGYSHLPKEILEKIDIFLYLNQNIKPKDSFNNFWNENYELLNNNNNNATENLLIKNKIKKTFKNRYFLKK